MSKSWCLPQPGSHGESDTTSFLNPVNSWKTGHKSPQMRRAGSSISCPSLSSRPFAQLCSASPLTAAKQQPQAGIQKLQHPGRRVQARPADLLVLPAGPPHHHEPQRFLHPTRRCHHHFSSRTQHHRYLTWLCLTTSCSATLEVLMI